MSTRHDPDPPPTLAPGAVHVWLTEPAAITDSALLDAYTGLMSPEEHDAHRRFRFEALRHQYLVTRALVRATLSRYADVDPGAWRFRKNPHGRPELVAGQCPLPLRFNLSHTPGLAACAVTLEHDVGVDVEHLARATDTARLARRFFAPEEAQALEGLPEPVRRPRFLRYWTLKEAYIKARGRGLSLPLSGFAFRFSEDGAIAIHIEPALEDDPRRWQFRLLRPTPEHVMAVALGSGPGPDLAIEVLPTVPAVG